MRSPDERIVALLQEARLQLEAERSRRNEPIAIVGIGCRFPGGASSPAAFWSLLEQGFDATSDVPVDRWAAEAFYDSNPDAPGKAYTKRGSFLTEGVAGFDAEFFGISPREAVGMDPQQRLLLEVVWEALEDAGIAPERLRGSATGVWVGLCVDDYARRCSSNAADIDAYNTLGNTRSIAAGRISYALDLRGPTLQLDTACSSSLVALHQACLSLRSRECELALVGGVNLMLAPEPTIALCKLRALAPDGYCKTFDASADGYGRGEGCGIVVLKRLADAVAAGDRIYAVVRGSACNHDGHSNGLTAPSGIAQEAVIRAALANGGVEANSVAYVEAHGTGTLLGDPIEVLALHRVYGQGRSAGAPLYLGAVKTNFGHLEGAAGVAGLIKVALSLQHGQIPRHLHLRQPNPKIPWQDLAVKVASEPVDWARHGERRFAGVSSFGISGTNAHVVLEEAPALEPAASTPGRVAELIVISARTPAALSAAAGRLREHLESHPELVLGDVAHSLVTTRSLQDHRLTVTAASRTALLEALGAAAQGQTPVGAQRGAVGHASGKLGWLFTGQGAQRLGMGRELYAAWPAFGEALDAVVALLDPHLGVPLREVMWAEPGSARAALLDQTGFTQPALFALEWALAALWRSWGIEPEVLLGHSIGGLTAATVAGVFSLEDGARLVSARARLMQALPAGGAMVSLSASEAQVRDALRPFAASVSLAAVNGPASVVISGREADVSALAERFQSQGVQTKRLAVSHAFHSPLMDPMLAAFRAVAESIAYHTPSIPLVSDSTGTLAGAEISTAEYWVRHVRDTVRFAPVVQALAQIGVGTFLELGPRPTLLGLVPGCVPGSDPVLLSSLRSGRSEPEAVLDALGGWVVHGGGVDWKGVFPAGGRRVPLPNYPWQRERYWIDAQRPVERAGKLARWPLAGRYRELPGGVVHHVVAVGTSIQSYLQDHVVHGAVVVPGAFFVSVALACAAERWPEAQLELEDVEFVAPLFLNTGQIIDLDVLLTPAEEGNSFTLELATRTDAEGAWSSHARARARVDASAASSPAPLQLDDLLEATQPTSAEALIQRLSKLKIDWGPEWRWMSGARAGARAAISELTPPSLAAHDAAPLHPVLLDNGFGTFGLVQADAEADDVPRLPFAIGRMRWMRPPVGAVRCGAQLHGSASTAAEVVTLDMGFWDATGELVAVVERFAIRIAPPEIFLRLRGTARNKIDHFYRVDWIPVNVGPVAQAFSGKYLVIGEPGSPDIADLDAALRQLGGETTCVNTTEAASLLSSGLSLDGVFCRWEAGDGDTAAQAQQLAIDALKVVQALAAQSHPAPLWWVTRSAVALAPGEDVDAAAATLWGLGRTVMQEHTALRCTLIDVERDASLSDVLHKELSAHDDENQIAWRGGKRHVARLVRAPVPPAAPDAVNCRLETLRKGTLDSLTLIPCERRNPASGEVEIEVVASGLNFRDVLNALGMYPGEAGPLGAECSGVVTGVGAKVEKFAVGDLVMALAPGTFGRFVTVDARLVAPVPSGLSMQQAAAIPVAFLTAWHALHDLAKLQPGERIVIHAAAGGVGMAAIQLAHWIGAEVFATASPSKWAAVRALDVQQIASSRDLAFSQTFKAAAGGADVVLNSLAGEFIDASLSLLSPGGRFIEMGKIDLRDPAQIASSHPGVSYRSFDLTLIAPDRIAEMLAAIGLGFESRRFLALPVRSFALTEAETAFRFMAQARHTGKIALLAPRDMPRTDGTVLVTGGLGALGLEVAKDFARRGAQHLLLTGRRGLDTPGAEQAVAELEALGAEVSVASVDVADRPALARVLSSIPVQYPLRAVVHAAGVLDDGMLIEQTPERFARVMAPKVHGAWNLHELTRGIPLDSFVLFSSMAGTLGSAAQAGYAAANSFLDALATHRRAQGLPALSLAWGPWAESGMAAALDAKLQARFARQGISMLSTSQGLSLLEGALRRSEPQLVVVPLDVRVASRAVAGAIPPVWRSLLSAPASRAAAVSGSWSKELSALPVERRLAAVSEVVRDEVARILSLPSATQVPVGRPLQALGLDSLMAVELRNVLGQRAGVPLSATLAFDHPTVEAIAEYLLAQVLQLTESERTSADAAPSGAGLAAAQELLDERWHDQWHDPDSQLDLNQEAALEGSIAALPTPLSSFEPTSVFLTGATGFLGAFLLWELLRQTRARVTCLVRARTPEDGLRRIESNLVTYGLWNDALKDRLSVVVGDLGQPLLGLDKATFRRLAAEIDAIYNNGANVSFVLDYRDLRPSHVQATRELLRLASLGRPKALHHVSSVTAFDAPAYRRTFVSEAAVPAIGHGIRLPYAQCKWVSEAMVRAAGARGIPITIHRPSFIGGATDGAWNTTDFLCRVLKGGAIDIGCLPGDVPLLFDFSPVDFVARSIVYLSRQDASSGKTFHLQHPTGLLWSELAEMLPSLGYPIERVPYATWLERLSHDRTSPIHPLLRFFTQRWQPENLTYLELTQVSYRVKFQSEETTRLLDAVGIRCAPLDRALFQRYFRRLAAVGFIAPPRD